MRRINNCSICNKQLALTYSTELTSNVSLNGSVGTHRLNFYKCGHFFLEDITDTDISKLDFHAVDGSGKMARDYQKIGVKFILDTNFNCIIGDQMRLGKTPQSLLALKNKLNERTPCLILVRSPNLYQWMREFKTWVTQDPMGIYPIISTKAFIPKGFKAYLISMDTFSRNGMSSKLLEFGFRLVIADEAHSFKNTDSNRSRALVSFLSEISQETLTRNLHVHCVHCQNTWDENIEIKLNLQSDSKTSTFMHRTTCKKCGNNIGSSQAKYDPKEDLKTRKCGVILLTGTAVKNRADEFFVPLNLVAPADFYSLKSYQNRFLEQDAKGKYTMVRPYLLDSFKEKISPYFLRREKEDVYTDLPLINKIYTIISPDNDQLRELYNKELDKLEGKLAKYANPSFWEMQENLMALRVICGMMKVPWTADYLESCLADSENQRYCVGVNHHAVRDMMKLKLGTNNCLTLSGEDNSYQKDYIMRNFETSKERVLIMNMIAGGIGMDFHYVNNILILERMWSSADEDQFEFRFYNPDLSIKQDPTNVEYILIKDSIEERFYEMIEKKRIMFGTTIGTNYDPVRDQSTNWRELAESAISSRL